MVESSDVAKSSCNRRGFDATEKRTASPYEQPQTENRTRSCRKRFNLTP